MAKIAMTSFSNHPPLRCKGLAHAFLFFLWAGCFSTSAQSLDVKFSAGQVQYRAYTVTGLTARSHDGDVAIQAQRVVAPADVGLIVDNPTLSCAGLDLNADGLCAGGAWSFVLADAAGRWQLPVAGTLSGFSYTDDAWTLQSVVVSGKLRSHLAVHADTGGVAAEVDWVGQHVRDIPGIAAMPPQLEWVNAGMCGGELALQWPAAGPATAVYKIFVEGLGFDSPDGRYAGENLALRANGSIQLDESLHGQLGGDIHAGDLLLDNFYTSFSGQALQWSTQFNKQGSLLRLGKMRVSDGRSVDVKASAELDLQDPVASLRYQVGHFEMHFPEAYTRYVESMASAWTLDGLTITGSLHWSDERQGRVNSTGVLDVTDLTIVDGKRGRFAVTGLAAHILPGDQGLESRFSWQGLLFQRINLGRGEVGVKADPGQFSLVQPLQLNVLGGRLAIDDLRVKLPGSGAGADSEPEIRLYATLDNLDMEQLTRALGWPVFGGSISGNIPGVTLNEGVLAVDGQIAFRVFDGEILLSGLRVERPFGVLPSLAANLEVRNLDLQQLTSTFSFGNISGRMSGFVNDLRMLDWSPVAFDAWFGTPQKESGSHEISRQAVNRLTNIGGGGPTATLTGPILKLFSNFSYKRLGLGCRLQNNICEVRGLDDDAASVLIMDGAGIPKIMIRAYNRQMDWPTLVKGLTAASAGESIRMGKKP